MILLPIAGAIEASYSGDNPYHTAVHAADVMQATHCNIVQSPVNISCLSVGPSLSCLPNISGAGTTGPIKEVDGPTEFLHRLLDPLKF